MPSDAPTPVTPEGKRAADKMRNIFACIVAANVALIAIVMWQGYFRNRETPPSKEAPSTTEQLMNHSIATYNAGDTVAFSALFTGMPADPAMHHVEYHREFGRILAWKLISPTGSTAGDGSTVTHGITCEKEPHARLVTKFTRENGAIKLTSWSIERP